MELTFEQLQAVALGAVYAQNTEEGIHFHRFSPEEEHLYENSSLYPKLFAPAGAAGLTVLSVFVMIAVPAIFLVLSGRKPVFIGGDDGEVPPPAGPVGPTDMGQSFYSL